MILKRQVHDCLTLQFKEHLIIMNSSIVRPLFAEYLLDN